MSPRPPSSREQRRKAARQARRQDTKRPPGPTFVESFRAVHITVAALIPGGDVDGQPVPPEIEVPQVQLILVGQPPFLTGDGGSKRYVTYLDPQTAIAFGSAIVEEGNDAKAATVEEPEDTTEGGLILGGSVAQAAAEAEAAQQADVALRKGADPA